MVIQEQQTTMRKMKAMSIVGLNQVKRITVNHYKVKSQSSDTWYDVRYTLGSNVGYTCTCPDFVFRKVECKHQMAVYMSKQLRHKIIANSDIDQMELSLNEACKCGSTNFRKDGVRKNKACQIQRYRCLECGKRFCNNIGLRSKVSAKTITASLDLYFKGVSLRQVRQHLLQFYGVNVTHVAIYKWICKFSEIVTPYADQLMPHGASSVHHVDEMVVHVRRENNEKGHSQWLWNLCDSSTRYWICSKISQAKKIEDARAVFQDARKRAPLPQAIVHDGWRSYDEAFNKEYYTNTGPQIKNIRSISVRKKGLNQKIERINGTLRDREKTMRGMHSKKSAQKLMDGYRTYYNHIREHSSIKMTPAEKAGIKIELGKNRIENLFRLANGSAS